jgi:P27 family predicted phage terminase small subunit
MGAPPAPPVAPAESKGREMDSLHPPSHLSEDSKALWRQLLSEYDFQAHELKLLRLACEAWDRAQQARKAIGRHGLTYESRPHNAPRQRPEVAIERTAQRNFSTLMRQLGIPTDEPSGRPSGRVGRPPRQHRHATS